MPTTQQPNCFRQLRERGYKFHVFISWPSMIQEQGRKLVEQLYESLVDRFRDYNGGEVFLDRKRLGAGYDWDPELRKSLCRSGVTIAILVPSYFDSPYCRTEWHITETLQKSRLPEGTSATCFVPLLLKQGIPLPEELKKLVHDPSFGQVLSYGRDPKKHPKWHSAVNALVDRIEGTLKLMCQEGVGTPDWTADEEEAKHLGPKNFTWPDPEGPAATSSSAGTPPSPAPRRELPPAVGPKSKL